MKKKKPFRTGADGGVRARAPRPSWPLAVSRVDGGSKGAAAV